MSENKVKLYKNPSRKENAEYKSYVPQYQLLGIDPVEFKSSTVPVDTKISQNSQDNPRIKEIGFQKKFDTSDVPNTQINLPAVGQNREHTWAGVDGDIIDDLEVIDVKSKMIDNNEYLSEEALGHKEQVKTNTTVPSTEADLLITLSKLEDKNYIILVDGTVVSSGTLEHVEKEAELLAFGDHPICDGEPIPVNELLIIKKIPIKIGLFLE